MFEITLKNYRCFSESAPTKIEIQQGFTALVGTNNSGKSSFLRFFNEFRILFHQLQKREEYNSNNEINFGLTHTEDWHEIFCNKNQHDLVIEIVNTASIQSTLSKIRLTISRNKPNFARIELWVYFGSERYRKVSEVHSVESFRLENQLGIIAVNTEAFRTFASILSKCLYIGPFRNAISEGSGAYYDIAIGTTFISQWDGWKTGASRLQNEAAQNVTDDIAHIFDFHRMEVNATPDKKALQVIINGKPYRLRELGAGLAQFIIVFGNVANRKPTLLLIDEPELNLHPSLQMDFLTSLTSYTTYGVMFASHSIGLARAVSDRIYTFQKSNDCAYVKPFEQITNFSEFVGEMSFSSFKGIGCDRILLVEGVTEVKTIQQFLRHLRKDHSTVLIPLGGSQMIRGGVQQELYDLTRLSNNITVLIDSERESENEPLSKDRKEFINDCETLGFKTHATKFRAIENYFCERAIKEEKGDSFRALGPYEKLASAAQGWAKSDNWRMARRMTRDELLTTDVGAFLKRI